MITLAYLAMQIRQNTRSQLIRIYLSPSPAQGDTRCGLAALGRYLALVDVFPGVQE
jgi:hypothetical protein